MLINVSERLQQTSLTIDVAIRFWLIDVSFSLWSILNMTDAQQRPIGSWQSYEPHVSIDSISHTSCLGWMSMSTTLLRTEISQLIFAEWPEKICWWAKLERIHFLLTETEGHDLCLMLKLLWVRWWIHLLVLVYDCRYILLLYISVLFVLVLLCIALFC